MPSANYYCVVHQGYKDCGLDTQVLNEAVQKSAGKYYENVVNTHVQQLRVRVPTVEEEDEEELDEDEELDEEDFDDEEESLDYSGGMQL